MNIAPIIVDNQIEEVLEVLRPARLLGDLGGVVSLCASLSHMLRFEMMRSGTAITGSRLAAEMHVRAGPSRPNR
jgi:hypothetical protein